MSFSKRFAFLSLRILDAFLPRQTRHWPTGDRFRARSAALIIFVGLISIVLHVLQLHSEGARGMLLTSGYVFLTLITVFMIALKFLAHPQLVGTAYIIMLCLITFWFTGRHARSLFAESFYWFPTFIIAFYLVGRPRLASWMGGIIIAGTLALVVYLRGFGPRHPFGVAFDQYTIRLASTLLLCNAANLLLVLAFLALTRATRLAWKQEKEWQLQSARMRELSELSASAALLMEHPLQNLQAQHAALLAGTADAETDKQMLREMDVDLQQMTRISESFSLLARPRQKEEAERMDAGIWLQHLTHIVQRRVSEKSWNLRLRYAPDHLRIHGPMGRLSMLIVLCLQETFVNQAPEPDSPLQLAIQGHPDHVTITIEYPKPHDVVIIDDPVSQSLIEELLISMAAVMCRRQDMNRVSIIIQGPWHEGPRD